VEIDQALKSAYGIEAHKEIAAGAYHDALRKPKSPATSTIIQDIVITN